MKSANVSRIFGISETGAYGVPSKSQNLIILGQGGSSKGQLISKCLFGVIVWTKNQRKNHQNFCPIEAKTEILVIFSLVFCPNNDTKKTF